MALTLLLLHFTTIHSFPVEFGMALIIVMVVPWDPPGPCRLLSRLSCLCFCYLESLLR
uniref:Uncharacterized protein LOC103437258 n=1 Tax=Rhizophora mucronata TaxID=61149 RepID=A0A2P2IY27_RHIMU